MHLSIALDRAVVVNLTIERSLILTRLRLIFCDESNCHFFTGNNAKVSHGPWHMSGGL